MKYKLLARIIKALLILGLILFGLTIILQIGSNIFNFPSYIRINGGRFGDKEKGYLLPMYFHTSLPDTVIQYKNGKTVGNVRIYKDADHKLYEKYQDSDVVNKFVNKLQNGPADHSVEILNSISFMGYALLKVNSDHKTYTFLWAFFALIRGFLIFILLIILISLINIYLAGDFLIVRSFRLITWFGVVLILRELTEIIYVYTAGTIVNNVNLNTRSLVGNQIINNIEMSFNSGGSMVDLSNVGIGIIIILLSKVIMEAVLIKQENDLTI
ncbi:DUF2975 domain-containing protein [Pedobacter frigidisoli]|uniref:DUF2975 domain-containing protein n=1 Tax=Pedobacter frigidisoli TaxID=2530455 RepID=A0A4R0P1G4_9SPHI|nr:DUF2975 domain-containing protein [Pedobacter frigidisoli]TCD10604.1 DUF2975 domain-containing protein [Pedobacter frigidisoli]